MKILLTVPFFPFRHSHPPLPDLGLGYLAASLRQSGHEVSVNDWNNRSTLTDLNTFIKDLQPQLVGIKFFTFNVDAAQKTLSLLRSILGNETVIVLGGPHPSAEDLNWLHQDFPEADGRFIGEAERSLVEFSDRMEQAGGDKDNFALSAIAGFQPFDDAETQRSQTPMTIIEDLDSLPPPAWDLIRPDAYPAFQIDGQKRILAPFMASRGCPLGCKFCCTDKISGKRVRYHSPDYISEQIRYVRKHHSVSALTFLDTNFMTRVTWLQSMIEQLLPFGREIVWNCVWGLAPESIDRPTLLAMREAGCKAIIMGIESGNDHIRKNNGKSDSVDRVREQINQILQAGIAVHGFFMLGFPDETLSQMRDTISLAFSLPFEALSFSIVSPLPGTEHYDWLKSKYNLPRIEWTNFNIYTSDFHMSHLSSRHISLVRRYAQIRNMLSPKRLQFEVRRGILSTRVIKSKLIKLLRH